MRLQLGFVLFLMVLISNKAIAQDVHKITLLVDTKNSAPEKAYILKADENTTVLNSKTQDTFTIFTRVGDQITWNAKSSSESDVLVSINQIVYRSGPRIFSSDVLKGDNMIQATVIRGGDEMYTYQLQFTIGTNPKVYTITPEIKIGD